MAKIAISVPDTLLDAIENERAASGVSRSEFFRRAVEEHLRRERERGWDEQYIRAYLENPETAEEVALATVTMGYAFAENPWDADAEE
jgi:metal-responsive CopG/Arc/MetJ family transcriptional regulator